jgi:Ferritin-like domain
MRNSTTPVDVSHLAPFDSDGALAESADQLNKVQSRRSFMRGTGIALGGAALASGFLPGIAGAFSSKEDVAILNYALTLEYLETAFYKEALKSAGLSGEHLRFAKQAYAIEDAHVGALKQVLKSAAIKSPKFDFGAATQSTAAFTATSIVLEDTGVQAYQGQAGNIKSNAVLAAALSIHPVEARQAAWIRNIAGQPPAPDAFNPALSMSAVLAAVKGTGFIQ